MTKCVYVSKITYKNDTQKHTIKTQSSSQENIHRIQYFWNPITIKTILWNTFQLNLYLFFLLYQLHVGEQYNFLYTSVSKVAWLRKIEYCCVSDNICYLTFDVIELAILSYFKYCRPTLGELRFSTWPIEHTIHW